MTNAQVWKVRAPFTELMIEALGNLYALRQRSALALLGIVIGTASVVAMLTIGHMAEAETLKLFRVMGVDMLSVQATSPNGEQAPLDRTSIEALPGRHAEIAAAAPLSIGHAPHDAGGPMAGLNIVGSTRDIFHLSGLELSAGRFLQPVDKDGLVVVLGAEAAGKLSESSTPVAIGREIRVGHYLFSVVGILAPTPATAFDPADYNNAVFMPLQSGERVLGTSQANAAVVRMRPGADVQRVAGIISSDLAQASPNAAIRVQGARQLIDALKAQKAVHARLLAAIGGISLLVGGIGVMNVMLMSVMERRREIGVRSAIGATPGDVQLMFLIEAVTLAVLGGLLGTLSGVVAALAAARASHWSFSAPLYVFPLGVGLATLVGIAFGVYPAIKASRLDPIEALRAE